MTHTSRRRFLQTVAAGTALVTSNAARTQTRTQGPVSGSASDVPAWEAVRSQFTFTEEAVPMNAANLCPAPLAVADRLVELTRDVDMDCSSHNRRHFTTLVEHARQKVAAQLGVTPNEIALVRNTSEANNIINNGVPLKTGDQIVVWDQNHPTNNVAWDVRAARFGAEVIRVSTPGTPTGVDELVGAFEQALTSRTRVLALTHASNISGVRLPVYELCALARRRSIYVHVDGAQSWGALDVNLASVGCDSYSASVHKWFCGPREVGLLYVRQERIDDIWPGIVGANWGGDIEPDPDGAKKFESLGQRDDAALAAVETAAGFHDDIGLDQTERRVTELASLLKQGLVDAGYELVTPMAPELSAGVCIARVDTSQRSRIVNDLYERYGIAGAGTGGLRLSPHIYNTRAHIARAIEGARALREA